MSYHRNQNEVSVCSSDHARHWKTQGTRDARRWKRSKPKIDRQAEVACEIASADIKKSWLLVGRQRFRYRQVKVRIINTDGKLWCGLFFFFFLFLRLVSNIWVGANSQKGHGRPG